MGLGARRIGTPLQVAAETLSGFGYEPRIADDVLVLANCPFHALATTHTQLVCEMNHALLGGVCDEIGGLKAINRRMDAAAS